jgi:hypothetical protein
MIEPSDGDAAGRWAAARRRQMERSRMVRGGRFFLVRGI